MLNITEISLINECIDNCDVDVKNYKEYKPSDFGIVGDDSNCIYMKDEKLPENVIISYGKDVRDNKFFISDRVRLNHCRINFVSSSGIIYVGRNCRLERVNMSTNEQDDKIFVGNDVTTGASNLWTTGFNSNRTGKLLLIGDDCMFSAGIVIRVSDGHPIFNIDDMTCVNNDLKPLVIEPHCWIGQNVFFLKNVRVGACSVVGSSAVVSRSCKPFSMMAGVPATPRSLEGKIWARNHSDKAKKSAKLWAEKYKIKSKEKYDQKKNGKGLLYAMKFKIYKYLHKSLGQH